MDVREAVENAWGKVIEDFERDKGGWASVWREQAIRLNFFQHFCKQKIDILNILAEFSLNIGEKLYTPDIIVYVKSDEDIKITVLEFKYYDQKKKWLDDWERLHKYAIIGFDYGYFLAIGPRGREKDFPRKMERVEGPGKDYELRALIHPGGPLKFAPDFEVVEEIFKKTLQGVPYVVPQHYQAAIGFIEDYMVIFDISNDKCEVKIIRADGSETLLGKFEPNSSRDNVLKIKENLQHTLLNKFIRL